MRMPNYISLDRVYLLFALYSIYRIVHMVNAVLYISLILLFIFFHRITQNSASLFHKIKKKKKFLIFGNNHQAQQCIKVKIA